MTIRLMCDARGKHRTVFLDRLLEIAGDKVELTLHMGHDEADWHAPAISEMARKKAKGGHFIQNQKQTGANMALLASDEFGQMLETGVIQIVLRVEETLRLHDQADSAIFEVAGHDGGRGGEISL